LKRYPVKASNCRKFRPHSVLRLFRLAHPSELLQRGLGRLSGVHINTIEKHESGHRRISWDTAKKYAEALGCKPEDLL
jgi:DNA-binding XRE family transcriptional regulator